MVSTCFSSQKTSETTINIARYRLKIVKQTIPSVASAKNGRGPKKGVVARIKIGDKLNLVSKGPR